MGAMPWQNLAPWDPDPTVALRRLQESFFRENHDLPRLLEEHLDSAREAVRLVEAEGDEYGTLHSHRKDLERLEAIAAKPLPDDALGGVDVLRAIFAYGGQGIGDVLDVLAVTSEGGIHETRRLSDAEISKLLGTSTPRRGDVEKLLGLLAVDLGRGESVCCPVFEDGEPIGWWFVGYTVD